MTAAIAGPYEHTGAYRPDVIAQAEGTEPQWSDAPVGCETPEPDLGGRPLPSLAEFAYQMQLTIGRDAYKATKTKANPFSNVASALAIAAAYVASDIADVTMPAEKYSCTWEYERTRWLQSHIAWRRLQQIRAVQLGGLDAMFSKVQS